MKIKWNTTILDGKFDGFVSIVVLFLCFPVLNTNFYEYDYRWIVGTLCTFVALASVLAISALKQKDGYNKLFGFLTLFILFIGVITWMPDH